MNENKTVFIISGPCGVGKSTISEKLAQSFERSSHINADFIYHMVVGGYLPPWEDDGSRIELLWSNVSDLTRNYLEGRYDVVIDYVVFPENLNYIKHLKDNDNVTMKYIVLMANEDIIRKRDQGRLPDHIMGDRAIEVLNEFREKKIEDRYILDTSDKSIEEIILEIKRDERFII